MTSHSKENSFKQPIRPSPAVLLLPPLAITINDKVINGIYSKACVGLELTPMAFITHHQLYPSLQALMQILRCPSKLVRSGLEPLLVQRISVAIEAALASTDEDDIALTKCLVNAIRYYGMLICYLHEKFQKLIEKWETEPSTTTTTAAIVASSSVGAAASNPEPARLYGRAAKYPRKVTDTLVSRFIENQNPDREMKEALSKELGLSLTQINNWYTNIRKRHWYPLQRGSKYPTSYLEFELYKIIKARKELE